MFSVTKEAASFSVMELVFTSKAKMGLALSNENLPPISNLVEPIFKACKGTVNSFSCLLKLRSMSAINFLSFRKLPLLVLNARFLTSASISAVAFQPLEL